MKKIIFFTQSLGRTGSETALFNLVSKPTPGFQFTVVADSNGQFIQQLPSSVKVIVLSKNILFRNFFLNKMLVAIKKRIWLMFLHKFRKADYWYLNTIMFPKVLLYAEKHDIPVINHIHELEQMYVQFSEAEINRMISYPDLLIACSQHVFTSLKTMGRNKPVEIMYPSISRKNTNSVSKEKILQSLGISNGSFIWMMAGTADINKNPVLFIEIAEHVMRSADNAAFIWLYTGADNGYLSYCKKLIAEKRLNKIIFYNAQENFADYFSLADGLLLTSYKESFSLVTLEAHASGIPCIATDCGGVSEIITNETGRINKSNNPADFADLVLSYMNKTIHFDAEKSKMRASYFADETNNKWLRLLTQLSK
jgi:glycosyltransferase involved in cell wall biosynthesis